MTEQVSYIKNHLWTNIIQEIHLQWPSIQIIYEQRDLLQVAQVGIQKTKIEIADKPAEAIKLIGFLNSKNKAELEELNISDRTENILQIRKVLAKRNIMNCLEEKCEAMNLSVTKFLAKYTILGKAGLPDIHGFNEKLMVQTDYDKNIRAHAKEQVNKTLPQGSPTGKVVLQYFEDLFFLHNEIKHIFVIKPNFAKYTDADECYIKLKRIKIPREE